MARLRTDAPEMDGRPPIPEQFRRFREDEWITDDERARHRAFCRTATAKDAEDAAVRLCVNLYDRWRSARDAWGAAHGYSIDELWKATGAS